MKKGLVLSFSISALLVAAVGCSNNSDTVATVGDESITKDELFQELVLQDGGSAIEGLIDRLIIEKEVEKEEVELPEEEIENEYLSTVEFYGGEEALSEALEANGLTTEQLKNDIRVHLSVNELLKREVEITDDEVLAYFEDNRESYDTPETISASHILLEDEALANEIKGKIDDGEDFRGLAQEYSIDGSAEGGGDLGYFTRGEMVPEFEEVAFSLDVGEISDPVESAFGYHIIMVNDKEEPVEADFEDYKEHVEIALLESKVNSKFSEWMEEKREEYNIEIHLD